jgi:curved DNA-binding protein CbpA
MSESADLYRMLRVKPDADSCAIRAAYRRLAWQYHPDVGGSQRTMAALNEAWRILRDPDSRARYDGRHPALPKVREPGHPTPAAQPSRGAGAGAGTAPRGDHPTGPEPVARAPAPRTTAGGRPDGSSVMDFGRYEGWSLNQLATADPDYLEWLARTSIGRRLQPEIAALLLARRATMAARPGSTRSSAGPTRRWTRSRASAAR